MKEGQSTPCFSFTEREKLYDQITHSRFLSIVSQPDVDIHEVNESSNSFGEFLFVTLSCRTEQPKKLYTFYGLGFHEHRERWIADTWQWYQSQRDEKKFPILEKNDASEQIKDRETYIRGSAGNEEPQSRRAQLYEILADFTDEDGALSELDDLDSLGWAFLGGDED